MKKSSWLLPLALVAVSLQSCLIDLDLDDNCARGTGATRTEQRNVGAFSRIEASGSMEVIVRKGTTHELSITAQSDILPLLETSVNGNTLVIGSRRCISTSAPITVYVSVPELTALSMAGSGQINVSGSFASRVFEARQSGSGSITAERIQAERVYAGVSGSGSIRLRGTATDQEVEVAGSGQCDLSLMPSEYCDANVSGSGLCRVAPNRELEARVSGSGLIYYSGNPRVQSNISGSGRVVRM